MLRAAPDTPRAAARRTPVAELEFTGCRPLRASASEIAGPAWEGRKVEYWDAASETAWMVREPVSPCHERPAHRLAGLVERICLARGSEAACFGEMDLRIRKPDGTLGDLMQADESVYLRPAAAKLPDGAHLLIGEDDYPDVVLEVDHTTDVRRGKLVAYAEWGFPEVWVETPQRGSSSRPANLPPGLRIHLLDGGRYRESPESRAFPGWRAEEIHRALNEPAISAATEEALWRVGRALGELDGTAPEDDLLMRRMERRGHARALGEVARSILRRRGIEVSGDLDTLPPTSPEAVIEAALTADSAADFLARLPPDRHRADDPTGA